MRKFASVGLALWLGMGASASFAATAQADRLFEDRLYQEALAAYQAAAKTASGSGLNRTRFRIAECQALLFRYGEALQYVADWKTPSDPLWKARYLILRTELYREYLKQYGAAARQDAVEGDPGATAQTPDQMRAAIRDGYARLWTLRDTMLSRSIEEERDFVDLRNVRIAEYPTLWDFAASRWIDYLLHEVPAGSESKPEAADLLQEEYSGRENLEEAAASSPTLRAAALMDWSSRARGRAQARECWSLKRLLLPFDEGEKFLWSKDRKSENARAIATLATWKSRFAHSETRAEAGFRAADLSNGADDPEEALRLCGDVESRWPQAGGSDRCRGLRGRILMPELRLKMAARSSGPARPESEARNVREIRYRLYRTSPEEMVGLRGYRNGGWAQALNTPDREILEHFLSRGTPVKEWSVAVDFKVPSDLYRAQNHDSGLPGLELGLYVLIASNDPKFKPGESLVSGLIVNQTDLVLIGTSGLQARERDMVYVPSDQGGVPEREARAFRFYALDAATGRPAPDTSLDLNLTVNGRREERRLDIDKDGAAQLSVTVPLTPDQGSYFGADPLARRREEGRRESYAYWQSAAWLNFSVPRPLELFIDTDRPVYRPGQAVRFKVTAVARRPEGLVAYPSKAPVQIRAMDANGREIYKADLPVDSLGGAAGEFQIPAGRLLGRYSINVSLAADWGRSYSGASSFSVEEYKRPDFEVTLEDPSSPWRFGHPAQVKGSAVYYFGGAVQDAPVAVRVYRESFIPLRGWWWRRRPLSPRTEVARIDAKTDERGGFTVSFTPEPPDPDERDPLPAHFTVEAEARDPGGRTILGSKTFVAGKDAFLFDAEPSAGFMASDHPSDVAVRLTDLNGVPQEGRGRYELYRVTAPPAEEPMTVGSALPETSSLDYLYRDVPNEAKVAEGEWIADRRKPASVRLPGLPSGAYRMELTTLDPWGGEVRRSLMLIAASDEGKLPLRLSSIALPEHPEYQVGERARILLGSAELGETVFMEIWGGEFLSERRVLKGAGIRVVEVPVTEEDRGGFTVRWFGVRDFKVRSGEAFIRVPRKDRELSVRLRYDKTLTPGQKASWTLEARDSKGGPIDGRALLSMYDRSLEYYVQAAETWVKGLYSQRPRPAGDNSSVYPAYAGGIPVDAGPIEKILELFRTEIREPGIPLLRLNESRVSPFGHFGLMMVESAKAAAAPGALKKAEAAAQTTSEPPRKNFAETAVFLPRLDLKDGRAEFSFEVPEQLTGWRISGYAVTRDMKVGAFSEQAETRKDLSVQVKIPRFFRERDAGMIKAAAYNATDSEIPVSIVLGVAKDGIPADADLGLARSDLERKVVVPAHGSAWAAWNVAIPIGVGAYTIRAVARSSGLSDAEEREIPILPSRTRLIESANAVLEGDAVRTLSFKNFRSQDSTREQESLSLEIDPQLALTVLNGIPFLLESPYDCVEADLDRYVPLAIIHEIYKNNPELAAAAAKVPKRTTVTPSWDISDPRRLMSLLETPWVEISRGLQGSRSIVDLLDPAVVVRQKEDSLAKLAAAQSSGGGFSWFPGGPEDPYMTLTVLAGLAEARRYGISAPEPLVRRALNYVDQEIPKYLEPNPEDLSLLVYAAYVVTSFPRSYEEAKPGFTFAKAWMAYADQHSDALTPYGKALAAYAYWQLGDRKKGDSYLNRAMDGAREDPITGVYWTPEKNSWLWYNDTVEAHAFLIRTLQTMRPKDPRLPGLARWLLFNRKGNVWKSTKASAAAVYALLDFMKSRGALNREEEYAVHWGTSADAARIGPEDWLAKPLRWIEAGAGVTPAFAEPKIEKRGPGTAFAALTWIYSTDRPPRSAESGLLEIERTFYDRVKVGDAYHLKPLKAGDTAHVGDEIEVRLAIRARSSFEYVHVSDPKAAGFEAETLRSGWKWGGVARYEEPRDSLTDFFIDRLPQGEYLLTYRLRPTVAGKFRVGPAVLQSMYAPEFAAHSDAFEFNVAE